MTDNKLFKYYFNLLAFLITLSGTGLLLTWIFKTTYLVFTSEPAKTVHLDILIPTVAKDTTISTSAERALGYSMNIWQNTVENLGNDIATLEISLAIAGIVIAFLIALAGYYLSTLVKNNTKEIEKNKENFQTKINTLEDDYQVISNAYQNLTSKLKPGIDNIGKAITLSQVFSRNPYYNNGVLSFYALLIEWKRLLNDDEDLDDKEIFLLGCYHYSRGNYPDAKIYFDKIKDDIDTQKEMHINFYLGLLHDDLGTSTNLETAIDYYTKEINNDTQFKALSYSNRGYTYLKQAWDGDNNKYDNALSDFKNAISSAKKQIDPYPYYGIAICMYGKGEHANIGVIETNIEKGEELEKNHDSIKENYSRDQFASMERHIISIKSALKEN